MIKFQWIAILIGIASFYSCKPANPSDTNHTNEPILHDTSYQQDPPDTENKAKYLIENHRAGPFKIGDEIPGPATMMTYQMRMEQKTRYAEDGPVTETVTIIGERGEDLLWLKPDAGADPSSASKKIGEIIVISSKYQTNENIGIGSSLAQFKSAYPDVKLWYTYVSDMYVAETPKVKVQFLLDENDYRGPKHEIKSEITPLKMEDFKNTTMIKSVRII